MLRKMRGICILLLVLTLAACGKRDAEDNDGPKLVPVVVSRESLRGLPTSGAEVTLADGSLYYSDSLSEEETEESMIVYRKQEDRETEAIASFPLSDRMLLHHFADGTGSVYYVYWQAEDSGEGGNLSFRTYLRKDDSAGNTLYRTLLNEETAPAPGEGQDIWKLVPDETMKWYGINAGAADGEGRVCLYNDREERLLLFDAAGRLTGGISCAPMEQGGDAGLMTIGGDCYFRSVGQEKTAIRRIDIRAAGLSAWTELPFAPEDVVFLSGCDEAGADSFLVGMTDALYRYRLPDAAGNRPEAAGEAEELIIWNDLGLQGREVLQARVDGEDYQILNNRGRVLRLWRIERCEKAPDRQTVRVGVSERDVSDQWVTTIQELAAEFNYSSALYQVELMPYSMDAILQGTLQMELVNGEGPDVLELQSLFLSRNDLADKGILEDLSGYLDRSKTLGREDILPRILEAGSYGDQLISLIPQFDIRANAVRRGYTENGGWTVEDFFAYCAEYPEVPLHEIKSTHYATLSSLIRTNFSKYVDRERMECHFDTEDFVGLMESVKRLNVSGDPNGLTYYSGWKWGKEFCDGEFLVGQYIINDVDDYVLAARCLEGYGELAGEPTETGEPHYVIGAEMSLAINSKSQCKEGAWAFLEYVMTYDFQESAGESSRTPFPSYIENFEASLTPNPDADYVPKTIDKLPKDKLLWPHWQDTFTGEVMYNVPFPMLTEEDKEALRFMVDHMYYEDNEHFYYNVVLEESQAYFAGDKSAEETAGLIQNKINLYLQELK